MPNLGLKTHYFGKFRGKFELSVGKLQFPASSTFLTYDAADNNVFVLLIMQVIGLPVDDVVDAIVYILSAKPHAQVTYVL